MGASDNRQNRVQLGKVVFDPKSCQLTDRDGRLIAVREQSLRVLRELAENNGQTVERDRLIDAVWKGSAISDDSLAQCIKDIRAVLGDRDRKLLRTAVGRGYSLHGVREMPTNPESHPKLLINSLLTKDDDPKLADLAEVIIEELLVALTPRAGLKVTVDKAMLESADYTIGGRIRRLGEYYRVFVQLVRTRSAEVVFAETWNVSQADVDEVARQVTDKLASILRVHMFNFDGEDYLTRDNADLDTQELLAKAAYHMSRIQMKNRDVARGALSLAIEREPTNAMALAMRASAAVLNILQESRSKLPDSPNYCLELADRAMGLAPHIDFVNRARGSLRLWFMADHEGARADCQRALEINPVFHLAHQTIALSEILTGEHEAGIRRVKRILELGTPTNPRYPHYLTMLALGQILAGEEDAAIDSSREAHERAPNDPWCSYVYAAAAGDRKEITNTKAFQDMIVRTDLPITHFRDQAFTDFRMVDMLEERLAAAGFAHSS